MNSTMKQGIWDAINVITDLPGVWMNQKGAPKLKTPHFAVRLIFPGITYSRKANVQHSKSGKDVYIVNLATTVEVRILGSEAGVLKMLSAHCNPLFHKKLNQAGVVLNYTIGSRDLTGVIDTEFETIQSFDFYMTYHTEVEVQPEETVDAYIERVLIEGELGDVTVEMDIDAREE